MEKNQKEIISEFEEEISALKDQVSNLEKRVAEYKEAIDSKPADVLGDDSGKVEGPIDLTSVDLGIDESAAPITLAVMEPAPAPVPAADEDDLPVFTEEEPKETASALVKEEKIKRITGKSIEDVMAARYAWKDDMPGLPVKDIRSAISLNDRVLFINTLFKQDPIKFQDTLNKFNSMSSLDEAVQYISQQFSSWNLTSDIVYRFMMAVRRKLQ